MRLTNTSASPASSTPTFFARIEVEMQRRSAQLAALSLVIIADGASWIWDRVADLPERGQQVWHILDFWHACEHLATIARWLYGEGLRTLRGDLQALARQCCATVAAPRCDRRTHDAARQRRVPGAACRHPR